MKTGTSDDIDITVRPTGHDDHFAFLWQGLIKIPAAGVYTFELVSDDGSKLYFNTPYNPSTVPTVNNDGLHAASSATGQVTLAGANWYTIAISYFEKEGGESIQVYWSGPGFSRQLIPSSVFYTAPYPSLVETVPDLKSAIAESVSKETSSTTRMYLNPFSESFNIDFYNSSAANNVQVCIYDLKGRLLYMKNAGSMPAGNTTLQVKPDGKLLPGGVYVARLQINGLPSKIMKLVKIK